jgi:hypothetical protein
VLTQHQDLVLLRYTGTAPSNGTIGHGLGVAPKVIIFKNGNTGN